MELLSEQQQWYRNEYLLSDGWKERAKQRRAIDGFKCAICGKKGCLSVHHILYANIGNENVETDLVTLCEECHKSLHEQIKQHKKRLQEIDQEWRDAAHEALLPVMEKYRTIAGEEYAVIASEFNGGTNPKISTLIRLIKETSGYKPGYGQVYCSGAETSSSSVAMKMYSDLRKYKKNPKKIVDNDDFLDYELESALNTIKEANYLFSDDEHWERNRKTIKVDYFKGKIDFEQAVKALVKHYICKEMNDARFYEKREVIISKAKISSAIRKVLSENQFVVQEKVIENSTNEVIRDLADRACILQKGNLFGKPRLAKFEEAFISCYGNEFYEKWWGKYQDALMEAGFYD